MSDSQIPAPATDPVATLTAALSELNKVMMAQQARERARVAALSPAQLHQETRSKAELLLAQKTTKFAKRFGNVSAHIFKCETWTAGDFAWLLAGAAPGKPANDGLFLVDVSSKQEVYRKVLESCIGGSLLANPRVSGDGKARFQSRDLLHIASVKQLGEYVLVGRLLGQFGQPVNPPRATAHAMLTAPVPFESPAPSIQNPPVTTPRKTGEEFHKVRRTADFHRALVPFLIDAKQLPSGRLALNAQILDLRLVLAKQDVFWSRASARTFQRYCRDHTPPVELREGRPASNARAHQKLQFLNSDNDN